MKDIAIYGAGGFGREVASLIKRINRIENQWNFVGFFDDDFRNKPKEVQMNMDLYWVVLMI